MITEQITWHTDPADKPDADVTVLIELDPAGDYSEPTFLGFWSGEEWYDVNGSKVEVIAWAEPPKGSQG